MSNDKQDEAGGLTVDSLATSWPEACSPKTFGERGQKLLVSQREYETLPATWKGFPAPRNPRADTLERIRTVATTLESALTDFDVRIAEAARTGALRVTAQELAAISEDEGSTLFDLGLRLEVVSPEEIVRRDLLAALAETARASKLDLVLHALEVGSGAFAIGASSEELAGAMGERETQK